MKLGICTAHFGAVAVEEVSHELGDDAAMAAAVALHDPHGRLAVVTADGYEVLQERPWDTLALALGHRAMHFAVDELTSFDAAAE